MAFIVADRVKETTATTGTGTLNLAGAVAGYQSFVSGVGTGNVCNYCLLGGNGIDWETGIGLVTSGAPNTLTRGPITSSNTNAAISLTGTSTVFVTETAAAFAAGIGGPIVPPPKAASWTQYNFTGNVAFADVANGVALSNNFSGGIANTLNFAGMSVPATPYTIDARISCSAVMGAGGYQKCGVGWTDGTKAQVLGTLTGSGSTQFDIETFSNFTTLAAQGAVYYTLFVNSDLWMRLADNGTTVSFSTSNDGVSYVLIYSVAKVSGYLGTSGYSKVGFFIDPTVLNTGQIVATLNSWWIH